MTKARDIADRKLDGENLEFGDNDKAIFGAGSDLQIYHDGGNSLIQDAGAGDLILKSNGTATVIKTNAGNNLISARDAGSVGVFHDGSEKLTTTATGVDVTGTVTADGLTVDQSGTNVAVSFNNTNSDFATTTSSALRLGVTYSSGSQYGEIRVAESSADTSNTNMLFYPKSSQLAMTLDSNGDLLVGKTSADNGVAVGFEVERSSGRIYATADGIDPLIVNRVTSNGMLVRFRRNGSTVGSIDVDTIHMGIGSAATGLYFYDSVDAIIPAGNSSSFLNGRDNAIDLGNGAARFQDIFATNGTIQTSDRNEKQDIEALSDAEQRVAVAAKGLLRKYRWKKAVAEKGDAARIHFGIIAQDLQAAFEAEGLDAGRYGMFISSTWWEADRVIPAVGAVEAQDAVYETVVVPAVFDKNGNEIEPERTEQVLVSEAVEAVEAQPERIVTDTYQTQEEAPEGAVERTRMGVRYPELLAFIIAAI